MYFENREMMLQQVELWNEPHIFEAEMDSKMESGRLVVPKVSLIVADPWLVMSFLTQRSDADVRKEVKRLVEWEVGPDPRA